MTKQLLGPLSMVLLALGAAGCGSASKDLSSAPKTSSETVSVATDGASKATATIPKTTIALKAPARPGIDDTYDEDDRGPRKTEEHDDEEIEVYGRPATAAEWQSAVIFAKSYFAAAAAEDGAKACTLLDPGLAAGIAGNYEKPPNPSYLHGKTCAAVMTKLFRHRHKLMAAEAAGLEVTDVRVASRTVFILLAFRGIRERRFMGVASTSGSLKLEALLDSPYP